MFATIIISVLLAAVVVLIVRSMWKKKKSGTCSCGSGCAGCSMSEVCHGKK